MSIMVENIYKNFNNIYSVSKTLRFELKPQGNTLENIRKINLIEEDEQRFKDFQEVKKIIDKYFKYFIEKNLDGAKLEDHQIKQFVDSYDKLKKNKNDDKLKKEFISYQDELRKSLHEQIKGKGFYKYFFKKDFIKEVLVKYLQNKGENENVYLVNKFNDRTTYFTGFNKNRENIFSTKEIPTSIYYRIVNDNLPKYIENIKNYEKLKEYFKDGLDLSQLEKDFEKELNGMSLDLFFSYYNFNSFLNQKGIDKFNEIVGGKTLENGKKIQGLNEYINLYSQEKKEKSIRKLKFVPLFKQILSDRETSSFILDTFENEQDILESVDNFYNKILNEKVEKEINDLFSNLEKYDRTQLFIKKDKTITNLSQKIFGDWSIIENALKKYALNKINVKEKDLDKWYKKNKYFSIYEIEEGIELLNIVNDMDKSVYDIFVRKVNDKPKYSICGFYSLFKPEENSLFEEIKINYGEFEKLLNNGFNKEIEENTIIIKKFLDSIMNLYHFINPLYLNQKKDSEDNEPVAFEFDSEFYSDYNKIIETLSEIIPLYNKTRNFITKKNFSTSKFKLNFQNSTLLDGWDINKERDNWAVLFRKKGNYYLGIMSKGNNKVFTNVTESDSNEFFEKIEYKQISDASKDIQNLMIIDGKTVSKKGRKEKGGYNDGKNLILEELKNKYLPPEINEIRIKKSYLKSNSNFSEDDKNKFIDYYIQRLDYWNFDFNLKKSSEYVDFNEFTSHISNQGYQIKFKKISDDYINKLVDEGKLFLFQIYNKDFSKFHKGRKNMHTLYWEELFSEDNLNDVVYKLNGQAEIFFRKASLKDPVIHPKNQDIKNKDPLNNKKTSNFKYDLIKDRRYTVDKFLFHCPITMNFKAKGSSYNLNYMINEKIKENRYNFKILSIDRGERHLAYYTLINSKGEIEKQGTYNLVVDDFNRERNYHQKLDKLEGERDQARKSWKQITNIKELKEGYLSQIVHQITKLAIEENAIIVFEDLNTGFKRGRFKIEKQVYQKFEKMLIEKLNYLVFKDKNNNELGGLLKAYQLTPKFESFQKMGKQTGIIYYVNADYTSKIDFSTGFVNLLHPKYENIIKSKEFLNKFQLIKYNSKEDLFEFNFNYSDFGYPNFKKDNWSIWSNGNKIINFRNPEKNNQFDTKKFNPTDELKNLFDEFSIKYDGGENIISEILKIDDIKLFKTLTYILKIILQLRNSSNKTGDDYILSCVKDKDGKFFDSNNKNPIEPKDADANGAYHIGVKGLILMDRIKDAQDLKKVDKAIRRDDFINYIIERRWKTI